MGTRFVGFCAVALVLAGCGGGAVPNPTSPSPSPAKPEPTAQSQVVAHVTAPPEPPRDPFAIPEGSRDDDPVPAEPGVLPLAAWSKASALKGVPPAPPSCAAYAKRAAGPAPKDMPTALTEDDAAKRDAALVALGGGKSEAILGLRADLAPIECADAIVDPYLSSIKGGSVTGRVGHALVGLSLAAKLSRTAASPPGMGAARDKAKVLEHIKGPLKAWVVEQATAIEGLSAGAAGLSGYARGIAAVEAGTADLRLVDKIRSSPTPPGWDPELKQVYEAALDEALEPRKARGRDAALVGLGDLARAGSLHDARVDRARAILAKVYGGRRIDALDRLLLPSFEPEAKLTQQGRALARTPIFWSDRASWAPTDPAALRPALARGVPEALRAAFRAGTGPADLKNAYARARFDVGRLAWRRVDFVEAAHATDDRLLLALAVTLAKGPTSAADMMTRGPFVFDHTEALDAVAAEGGPNAGMAAFDAAHLRSLGAPEADPAAWLRDVAARFRKAEPLLPHAHQKKLALERAAEAEAAAAATAKKP